MEGGFSVIIEMTQCKRGSRLIVQDKGCDKKTFIKVTCKIVLRV